MRQAGERKMGVAMIARAVDYAVGALSAAASVARHVVWYVSYQIDGSTREDDDSSGGGKPR
jgi:hypothetical protein